MYKILLTILLVISPTLFAGSQSSAKANFSADQIANFTKQVERYAAAQGARAFIISRVGKDPGDLPRGIHFTHTAIAIYSDITLENSKRVKGYVIHNLYQRTDQPQFSDLVIDYPVDFFWGAHQLKAGITIPTAAVQQRLIEAISSGAGKKLHNANYSVISNPMNNKFQNCTEHTLLMLNAAIYKTTELKRLYANHTTYFTPQLVNINPLKLMLGSVFMQGVSTADHESKVKTATFTSISNYLNKYGLLHKSVTLDHTGTVTSNI